jgi:hypothetical protein
MEITPRRTRIDGDRATVEAGVTQWTQRQRDQRRRSPATDLEFRLQRTPGGWIISDIRPR